MRRLSGLFSLAIALAGSMLAQQEKGDKEIAFQGTVTIPFQNAGDSTLGTLIPRFGYFLSARNFVGFENEDFFAKGYQGAGVSFLYRFYMGKRGSRFQPYLGAAPGFLLQRQLVNVDIVVTQSSISAAQNQINSAAGLTSAQRASDIAFLDAEVSAYEGGLFCASLTALLNGQCTQVPSGMRHVTSHDFEGSGEVGFKVYLNRKFAFETSYRLQYIHESTLYAQDLYTATNSTLTPTNYTITFTGPTKHDGQQSGHLGFKESANNFLLFGFAYVF